jgi:hypothetical protein
VSDDFFYDAIPSCSFRGDPPIVWEGTILELAKKQATTYDPDNPGTGEPRFWPDGNPMMQGWITLQTSVKDNDDDDGRRVMVLDSKNKRNAVQAAVKESGEKIAIGGYLRVEYYGRDPNGKNADNLPKLYRAIYKPGDEAPSPTQPPQGGSSASGPTATATPVTAQAGVTASPANSGGGADPNIAKLIDAGVDPAKVATMTAETRALLAASM